MPETAKIELDQKTAAKFKKFCQYEQDFDWLLEQGLFNRQGFSREIKIYQDKRGFFCHYEELIKRK